MAIRIKEKNKGKFIASAKRAGRGVQQHAQSVLATPNATALQKKRANFAQNAAKWKKGTGGKIRSKNTRRVSLNDLMPFVEGGGLEGAGTKNLGTFRPTDFGYLGGNPDALESYGDISRDEFETFQNDPSQIPQLRNKINDAGWENIINAFQSDPSLRGLSAGNVKAPFGTGDRITGRYQGDLDALQPIAPQSQDFESADISPQQISEAPPANELRTSNKVNAYNYSKGRPYSKVERFAKRIFRGGGVIEPEIDDNGFVLPSGEREAGFPESNPLPEIPAPDRTASTDNTQFRQNRPTFFEGDLSEIKYADQRFGLSPILSDEFNQGIINSAYNPDSVANQRVLQNDAARKLLRRKCGGKFKRPGGKILKQ